jgi:ribosomal peptide maturation radical SAM protein 1
LAEWLFAVPPYLDTTPRDDQFLAGCTPQLKAVAERMRRVVPSFLEACVDDLLAATPKVVGFSTTFAQNIPSLVLAKMVKLRDPSVQIVFGGSNCDGPMGAALHKACPWIDVVVRGEAERLLVPLIEDLLDNRLPRPAPGLCYRTAEGPVVIDFSASVPVQMDEVPLPDYSEYFARMKRASFYPAIALHLRVPYESSRGCWWGERSHCTFCGLNTRTMAFRSKPATRVLDELAHLSKQTGVLDFVTTDNIADLQYFRELFPELARQGQHFRMFYEVKSNLKRDQVRLLQQAGVVCVQPGIESLSTPILKLMGKGVTAFQNIRLLKWCAEYGVRPGWNIIFGFPREPAGEYDRMADVMRSLTHLDPPDLTPLAVHRFSPYHTRANDLGLEIMGPKSFYHFLYDTDLETLSGLAYTFAFRHADGRNPEVYVGAVREVVDVWRAGHAKEASLRYRRGPDFINVIDRRPGLAPATYLFRGVEARIFDACEDGATPAEVMGSLGSGHPSAGAVKGFLDELVQNRLMYEESGRYLGLALPMDYAPPPMVTATPYT